MHVETPGVLPMPVSVETVHDCPVGQSASVPHRTSPVHVAEHAEPVACRQHSSPAVVQAFVPPQSTSADVRQPPATQSVPVNTPSPVRETQHDEPVAQSPASSQARCTLAAGQDFEHDSVFDVLS